MPIGVQCQLDRGVARAVHVVARTRSTFLKTEIPQLICIPPHDATTRTVVLRMGSSQPEPKTTTTRLGIRAFSASVVVNAVLGAWALLSGDFGETEGRVLATTFLISAAMLSVLINAPALRKNVLRPLPEVGAVSSAAGFSLFIVTVWIRNPDEPLIKLAASGLIIGGAATLATALRRIGEPGPARGLRSMTETAIAALSVTVLAVLWNNGGDEWVARLIGIESIAVAAGTLLIPVLARFGRGTQLPVSAEFACPHCGETIDLSSIER